MKTFPNLVITNYPSFLDGQLEAQKFMRLFRKADGTYDNMFRFVAATIFMEGTWEVNLDQPNLFTNHPELEFFQTAQFTRGDYWRTNSSSFEEKAQHYYSYNGGTADKTLPYQDSHHAQTFFPVVDNSKICCVHVDPQQDSSDMLHLESVHNVGTGETKNVFCAADSYLVPIDGTVTIDGNTRSANQWVHISTSGSLEIVGTSDSIVLYFT